MLGAVCRHWDEHEEAVRELRTLVAVTGADAPTDGVDIEYLRVPRRPVSSSAGHLRPRWSAADAVDVLVLLTSYPDVRTTPRLARVATPAQIEAVLAKLAVSIVSPSADRPPD